MSEQELVKVYELAKELGIDSISLLDKLKNLNIKVKNHMSELREEEAQLARTSLRKGGGSGKASAKSSSRTRRKATETSMSGHLGAAEALSSEKKAASPIIRRRIKGDSTIETPILPPVHTGSLEGSSRSGSTSNGLSHRTPMDATDTHTPLSSSNEGIHVEQSEVTSAQQGREVQNGQWVGMNSSSESFDTESTESLADHAEAEEGIQPAERNEGDHASKEQASSSTAEKTSVLKTSSHLDTRIQHPSSQKPKATQAASTSIGTTPSASASPTTPPAPSGTRTSAPSAPVNASSSSTLGKPAGKPPRPPIVLTPRPVAPRKSILKIVEATPPPPRPIIKPAPQPVSATQPKSSVKGTTTQDKEGYRIIKMTKENLDQMVEEEAAKKRGTGRDLDLRPEDVRFADYRKKELVFLPKKKKIPVGKEIRQTQKTVAKAQKRVVTIQESISIQDLANQLSVKANDVLRKLIGMGQMATINQALDFDTASLIANEYQYEARNVAFDESALLSEEKDDPEKREPRPPVVTIMGHVDHGKTTLLDSIREANVAGGEAGGITQHIGAYTVEKNGKLITFIDTPGHEAFTVMRARGANVTDIVILVVSADDGVMPQTREAISHAQAAKVPIIVAVNKIDKPGANPEKIKQTLAELNLLAEDWGGETQFVPVSALKKTNLDKLLDAILLQAEILDLKANPNTRASGTILEARLEKGRGPVMSVLIRKGTLRVGDPIVAGSFAGKVKALSDDKGKVVKSAGPGFAVEILGLEGVPNAGEIFNTTDTDATARNIAQHRQDQLRAKVSGTQSKVSLEQLFSKIQAGDVKELNVILKADAFGSVEAIRESLVKLSTEKVKVKPILTAAGGITESDVLLASASNAIIIGFNVRPETKARQLAESEHVEIKSYNIIYQLLDEVKLAMTGLLEKRKVEKFLGRAEVRQIFTVPKIGTVAGSSVIDGKIARGANVRLLRDSRVLYEGKMSSLRRFKDDVKEVATGFECGIGIESYNDLKPGDIIEAFQIELVTPELSE